jgi:hypothetical protein
MIPVLLSQLAAALLPAIVLDLMLARLATRTRAVILATVVVALLIPFAGLPAAQYVRGVTGDLSIGSMTMMVFYLLRAFGPRWFRRFDHELVFLAAILVAVAIVFYPMSLGVTLTDPYAHGYYPTVLSALLFSAFCWAVLAGWYLTAAVLTLSFAGFAGQWLESDNLWDYLFDPALVVAAAALLVARHREVLSAPWRSLFPRRFTIAALILVAVFLAFSVVLARVNPDAFANEFTVEDGFVEWLTSLTLFGAFCFSVHRLVTAHRRFGYRGKLVLLFIVAVCLFGAGEEISWGQRLFDIETPQSLVERNAQQELNLHNLTFEWNGKTVKVNRLVFGRGLALGLIFYLFVMTPLHRRNARVRRLIDGWAIPIPAGYQVAAYVAVVAVVELLIDSSKRGEMTEFAGAIVFMLNIALPVNREIYQGGAVQPPIATVPNT